MIIKGVSKCVVEIQDTGCEYFDRALFFIKPEYCETEDSKLRSKAQMLAKNADRPPPHKHSAKEKAGIFLQMAAGAIAGAAVTGMLIWIF